MSTTDAERAALVAAMSYELRCNCGQVTPGSISNALHEVERRVVEPLRAELAEAREQRDAVKAANVLLQPGAFPALRAQVDSLRAELARVTAERDEARGVLESARTTAGYTRALYGMRQRAEAAEARLVTARRLATTHGLAAVIAHIDAPTCTCGLVAAAPVEPARVPRAGDVWQTQDGREWVLSGARGFRADTMEQTTWAASHHDGVGITGRAFSPEAFTDGTLMFVRSTAPTGGAGLLGHLRWVMDEIVGPEYVGFSEEESARITEIRAVLASAAAPVAAETGATK